jgi:hypothetical protein
VSFREVVFSRFGSLYDEMCEERKERFFGRRGKRMAFFFEDKTGGSVEESERVIDEEKVLSDEYVSADKLYVTI